MVEGCGPTKKPVGKVTGQVLYKGKALTEGDVNFISKEGSGARGEIDGSGNYTADPVEVGTYTVYISPKPPMQSGPPGSGKEPKMAPTVIPPQYRDQLKSPLSYTVKEGSQEYKIELKD